MPSVVGIDLSTRAIDLVLLDENANEATHRRIELAGDSAFERCRDIRDKMPAASWYDQVYLIAIERPFSQSRNDTVRLAQGAILATLPRHTPVWEVAPQTWKAHLKFKGRGKPGWADFPFTPSADAGVWPQDALDALAVALYARDTNAAGIQAALSQ